MQVRFAKEPQFWCCPQVEDSVSCTKNSTSKTKNGYDINYKLEVNAVGLQDKVKEKIEHITIQQKKSPCDFWRMKLQHLLDATLIAETYEGNEL